MRSTAMICATAGLLAIGGIATTIPAQARYFHPGYAGAAVAGAIVAGAASSAYAYGPGPGYAYGDAYAYGPGPRYDGWSSRAYHTYGVYDESQHGGQPTSTLPY